MIRVLRPLIRPHPYQINKWSAAGKLFGFLAFVLLVSLLLKVVLAPLFVANTVVKSAGKIVTKTLDADNVIYNYEWFKKAYHAIQAVEHQIKNIQQEKKEFKQDAGPRKDWTFEDKTESSRLSATISGLKNHRNSLIAEYNAKSKMINRKIFKGGDLPEEIAQY
jgi:hypothetical protein